MVLRYYIDLGKHKTRASDQMLSSDYPDSTLAR